MTAEDRPLPSPPRSRFGVGADRDPATPLTADRIAQAAAAGKLEEFLQHEIPEGEHARALAMMMMGMSGMMSADVPTGLPAGVGPTAPVPPPAAEPAAADLPPDVARAVERGDIAGLTELLRAEHTRRSPSPAPAEGTPAAPEPAAPAPARPGIDVALVDELIRIAADNQVTVDWLMIRAARFYVEEYRRTGRL